MIAPNRLTFIRRSWFDILVLAVPMLRVLRALSAFRALKAARVLRVVSLFRLGSATRRGSRALGRFMRASRLGYVSAVTAIVVLVSAAAMLFLERDASGSQIRTYGDALWWSAALVTTVAGNLQPVTPGGRILAVMTMLYSVVVFGYLVSQAVVFIQPQAAPSRGPVQPDGEP
jgi:voltage-gated potassium channel